MGGLSEWCKQDLQLGAVAKGLSLITHFNPTNSGDELARYKADANGYTPGFEYADLPADIASKQHSLDAVSLSEGDAPIARILVAAREDIALQLELLKMRHTGEPTERTIEINQKLYGAPDETLVARAKAILRGSDPLVIELASRPKPSSIVLDGDPNTHWKGESEALVQAALTQYGLKDWSVAWENVVSSRTDIDSRRIVLSNKGRFGSNSGAKLAAHEVGVHALRGHNGAKQPHDIFRRGFPGYVATEEGLAVYTEKQLGFLSTTNYENYAARVIAVDALMRGKTFSECVQELMNYPSFADKPDKAFHLTLRAYRGGGFAKDQEYLKGLQMISDFVEEGGNLSDLYYGKFSLEYLGEVRKMAENGELTPKSELVIPEWIKIRSADISRS